MDTLQTIIDNYKAGKTSVIGLLQDISSEYGYVPEEQLEQVAEEVNVPLSHLYSLCTFYASLRLDPVGKHYCAV